MRVADATVRRLPSGLFEAQIRLGAPVRGVGSTWVGPKGFRRVLSARAPTLLVASATALTEPGVYSLVASSPAGDVSYVSFPVLARDLASAAANAPDGDDEQE
jgi:hypothetical protein